MQRFTSREIQPHEVKHREIVRKNAPEGTLFLKRNGDFPISPCKVNLYGSGARRTLKGGKGSGDVNTRYNCSIEEGLTEAGFEIATTAWMDEFDRLVDKSARDYWTQLQKEAEEQNTSPFVLVMMNQKQPVSYDIKPEGDGQVNIYVIARDSSEGMDRQDIPGDFRLLDCEVADITYLAGQNKKLLVVLNTGGVVDLSPIMEIAPNILLLGQLGAETGRIFTDILTGKSFPSGKLTSTWAQIEEYPSTRFFGSDTEVEYCEGRYVGYRYFDSFNKKAILPFGFGLGYTDFEFTPVAVNPAGDRLTVSVLVKNIGQFDGQEVIQAYFTRVGSTMGKQLIAFNKTKPLTPGEEEKIELQINMKDAAEYLSESSAFVLEKGKYQIFIGNSIENTMCTCSVIVPENYDVERVHRLTSVEILELTGATPREECETLLGEVQLSAYKADTKNEWKTNKTYKLAEKYGDEELMRICIGVLNDMTLDNYVGNSGKLVAGSAGETYSSDTIEPLVLADGPAGLRISSTYKLDENGRVKASQNALAGLLPDDAKSSFEEESEEGSCYQYCTAIPIGTALAQTWNPELCETFGDIVGEEMEIFDIDIWLAPAMNIHRNPLCGRNFEYYSEDPLISGLTAAAITRGVQKHSGKGVTIKHFCCNNQEKDRMFQNSVMSEKTLREIYLKGFKICIEQSAPKAMMTSYNLVNGVHTANSHELLRQVLREEWGYEGLVMTDWMSTGGFGTGKKYGSSTPRGCIAASNDLIMPGRPEDFEDIKDALYSQEISREELMECAERVLRLAADVQHKR